LKGEKCFKCHYFGHFQDDYPNRKALTIREIKEIQAIEGEFSDNEFSEEENNLPTLVSPYVGELLLTKMSLLITKALYKDR